MTKPTNKERILLSVTCVASVRVDAYEAALDAIDETTMERDMARAALAKPATCWRLRGSATLHRCASRQT